MTLGNREKGGGNISIGDSVYKSFLPLMKGKSAKDLDFRFLEIPEEGHYHVPYKAIYEGLKSLYADWILPADEVNKGANSVERFYENLSKKYKYKIELPESSYYRLIWSLFRKGKAEVAIKTAQKCLERFPELSYSNYILGRMYHLHNKTELAMKYYKRALEIERKNPVPDSELIGTYDSHFQSLKLICKIKSAYEERGLGEMEELYSKLKIQSPQIVNKHLLNRIGYIMISNGDFQDAISIFKLNVKIHTNYANGHDSLGEIYMKVGENEMAIKYYKKSLELDPGNNNARKILKQLK